MRAPFVLAALLFAASSMLPASDFDWMTRQFERESGTRRMHIPFMGLASFAVGVAHPAGVSSLRLAVFERPNVSSENFSKLADATAGSGWKPMVRVRDQSGEISNIYIQPDGKYLKLLIACLDKGEAVLAEMRIRPEQLIKFVDQHRHVHHA